MNDRLSEVIKERYKTEVEDWTIVGGMEEGKLEEEGENKVKMKMKKVKKTRRS